MNLYEHCDLIKSISNKDTYIRYDAILPIVLFYCCIKIDFKFFKMLNLKRIFEIVD